MHAGVSQGSERCYPRHRSAGYKSQLLEGDSHGHKAGHSVWAARGRVGETRRTVEVSASQDPPPPEAERGAKGRSAKVVICDSSVVNQCDRVGVCVDQNVVFLRIFELPNNDRITTRAIEKTPQTNTVRIGIAAVANSHRHSSWLQRFSRFLPKEF